MIFIRLLFFLVGGGKYSSMGAPICTCVHGRRRIKPIFRTYYIVMILFRIKVILKCTKILFFIVQTIIGCVRAVRGMKEHYNIIR